MGAVKAERPGEPARVLLVGGGEGSHHHLSGLLSTAAYSLHWARTPVDGFRTLATDTVDVVLAPGNLVTKHGVHFLREVSRVWPWVGTVPLRMNADGQPEPTAPVGGSIPVDLSDSDSLKQRIADGVAHRLERLKTTDHDQIDIRVRLNMLRALSETAIAEEKLDTAIKDFSLKMASFLPVIAVGVLFVEADERRLFIAPVEPLQPDSARAMEEELLGQFAVLTGGDVPTDVLSIQMDSAVSRGSIAQTARQFFPVPLVIGDRIQGVMTVATRSEKALNMAEILFLHETGAHVSAAVRALARMRELAVRDSLTGLYNRRGIKDMFDRAWNFASRYGHFIGVVILDVDRFKTLNDSYGHPTGDEVLREFAQLLLKVVRSVDIVGRFGGDEMVIILPAASAWNTRVLCERLLSEIRQHVFCERTHALRVTASLGAVSGTPQAVGRDGADNMMRWADQALYWAKRNGRDRLCLWSDTGPSGGRQTITEIEVPAAPVSGVKAGGPSRILIVDDEPDFSLVVEKMLSDEPYEITRAETAAAAMDRISQRSRCDVVLIDVGLAGESGIDLLEPLQKIDDTIVRIIVTGQATTENVVASLRRGAYDFIAKPFTQEQLLATLNRAVEFRRLLIENRNYQLHLEEMVRTRSVALSQALQQVRETHLFMLKALAALADAREHNTGQHSFRVSKLVRILGRGMGLPEKSVEELEHGALLHDIGKIAIPDAILLKPGPLDAEEWKVVRLHPEIGYKVLRGSPHLDGVARIVYEHQERFDGSGYPRGLKGAEICLAARIFAVVDTYDAMRSKRVYSDSSSSSAAVEEIKRFAGTKFDPSVVDNFLKCVSEIERTGNWPPA